MKLYAAAALLLALCIPTPVNAMYADTERAEFAHLYGVIKANAKKLVEENEPCGQFKVANNDNFDVIFVNNGGSILGTEHVATLLSTTISIGSSILDHVPPETRDDLRALLESTVREKKHTSKYEITLNVSGGNDVVMNLNVTPMCNAQGAVTGIVFSKYMSYYLVMSDDSFERIAEEIYKKKKITTSTSQMNTSVYNYRNAVRILTRNGHPPSKYRDDDSQDYYDIKCEGSWSLYMKSYLFYISRVMQNACYKTDIEIAEDDVMFGAGGRFQSDHINSNTNIINAESDKEFNYDYKACCEKSVLEMLAEGAKTMLVSYMFHEIFTIEHSTNLRDDLSGRNYEDIPIRLTSEVLDDPNNTELITTFDEMTDRIRDISFTELSDLAETVNIDITDVSFFTKDMWDGMSNKKQKIGKVYKNIIKRNCGGCILCYILRSSEAVYCRNLPVKKLVRLEFHHIDDSKKIGNISSLYTSEKLKVELPKVVCLCTPHHFYITNKRGDYESQLNAFILNSNYAIDKDTGKLVKINR